MLRIFGEKKTDALSQFIHAIWKKAEDLAQENEELSSHSIKIISKLLTQDAPWLFPLYENSSFAMRDKILTYLAVQFFLKKPEPRKDGTQPTEWMIRRIADKASFFHIVLIDPDFKQYLSNLNNVKAASFAPPTPPAPQAKVKPAFTLTPVARLKADIVGEVNEQKERMLIDKLIQKDRSFLINHIKNIKWVRQSIYNNNLMECLPDDLLTAILQYDDAMRNEKSASHRNSDSENQPVIQLEVINAKNENISAGKMPVEDEFESLEEEFETAVIEGLVEAIHKASDEKDSNKKGIIIYSSPYKASLPGTLFGSKENLSKVLEPVLTTYKEKARLDQKR